MRTRVDCDAHELGQEPTLTVAQDNHAVQGRIHALWIVLLEHLG